MFLINNKYILNINEQNKSKSIFKDNLDVIL